MSKRKKNLTPQEYVQLLVERQKEIVFAQWCLGKPGALSDHNRERWQKEWDHKVTEEANNRVCAILMVKHEKAKSPEDSTFYREAMGYTSLTLEGGNTNE